MSKSLQILPEKFHGLTNTDMRYRQRYVDLIMNQDVKDTFVKRSRSYQQLSAVIWTDRASWKLRLRCWCPMQAARRQDRLRHTSMRWMRIVKLRISLELYLKRLIVGGMERVYEIGRVFRNEGLDTRHNPEFTLMELVSGIYRLPRHDGSDREHCTAMWQRK